MAHDPEPGRPSGRTVAGLLVLSTCACIQTPRRPAAPAFPWEAQVRAPASRSSEDFPLTWNPGEVLLQGYAGARFLSEFMVSPSGAPPIELDDDEYEVFPVLGGGAQWKLAGRALDFGVEGMLAFSGRTNLEAFATSGGSTVIAFDVNLFLFEVYGGPFVSLFVGDKLRLYGSAGPLLQWAGYDQEDSNEDRSANGSGGGVYARGGFEFLLPSRKLVGLGVRWSESSIDLDEDFGDLDLTGFEVFISYSYALEPRGSHHWY